MNRISNVRGRVNTALMIMALLAFSAALFYGMRTALAWAVPDVVIASPSDGDSVSGTVPVSTNFSVSSGNIHSVVLLIDGVSVTTQPIGAQSGAYTFNWDSSTVANGAHTIAVRAYTAAAPSTHYNEASISVTVGNGPAPDITDPSITVTLPVDGQVYAVGTVGVNAGLSDNVAVNAGSVVVNMDGSNVNSQLAINASSVSGNLNVPDGNHTLTIDCSDTSGNPANQESISFKVDTTPPSLSITSPVDGAFLHTATANISGAVSDAVSGVDSVTVNGVAASVAGNSFSLSGVALDPGDNVITVVATDNAGHANTKTITVTYIAPPPADAIIPAITVTSPIDGQVYAAGTVAVNASLNDNVAVNAGSVVVKLDGSSVNAQLSINTSSVSGNLNVPDGNHTLTIDCSDTSGNPANQELISFKVDTTAPELSITSPADGAVFHTASANISGSVSDAVSGVDSVTVNGSAASVSGGSFSLNGIALDEGANVVTVAATDNAGHANTKTITVTYTPPPPADTTAPVLAVTSPLDGSTVNTATANVAGTVSDAGSGVKAVKVNGVAAIINGNIFSLNNVSLAEGANTFTVVAEDNSNNTSQEVVSVTYEPVVIPPADITAPTLAVTSPLDGSTVDTTSVNVTGNVSDAGSGVAGVTVNGTSAIINGNTFSLNNISLAEGVNTITVAAVDNAGNTTQEVVTVTYEKPAVLPPADTTAPVLAVTSPVDGLTVDTASVNVAGTVSDLGSGVAYVKVNGTAAIINGNNFSLNNVPLVEGANTITVVATDNSGNAAQEVVDVTYQKPVVVTPPPADTDGPVLAVTSPLDGSTVDVATVNVTGTVSDAGSGVKSVKVNGAAAIINGNNFSLNNAALVEGENVITVIAVDNSGNTTREVVNVTYEKPAVVAPPGEVSPPVTQPVLTLEVTSPEGGLITNSKNVTVTGTTANGAAVTVNGAAAAIGAGGVISYTAALSEGANTLIIKSCLGGDCMTETRAVTLDSRAPEIGGVAVDGGAVYVSLQDNTGGSGLDHTRAVFQIDGDETHSVYDQTRKAYKLAASGLAGGGHTVTALVYDVAGNAAQVSVSFTSGAAGGGVTVAIEDVPGKIVDLQTAGGTVYGPQPEGQVAAQTSSTSAAWNLALPQVKAGAEGFIKGLAEKDKERRVKLPPGVFGFVADQPKPPSPPHLDCGELRKGASAATPSEGAVVESVDGDIVAAADAPGGVDESSIVVQVDGVAVPHEYDRKTKKVTARAKGLKRGTHTATVLAADTLGNTGMATTAFGVDPIVYTISIDNADRPGTGHIAGGERARVTVAMDENNFSGAWIALMNANGAAPIGDKYYIEAAAPLAATGPFEYATEAYLYTSTDRNGAAAAAIIAGIPLDASASQFMTSASVLFIDNPPVNANFSGVVFNNLSGGASNSINQGDMYKLDASGSAGMQGVTDVLLNVDTLAGGVQNPWDASVRGDNMFESPQYGAGTYTTAGGGATLDILTDTLGHGARALLPLVCSTFAGNDACRAGGVVYVGQAPVIYDVLFEKAGAPQGEPFTQPGQQYKITIHGDIPPGQLPYLKAVIVNKDRMPQMLLFSGVNPYLTQYITNFVETSAGYYVAEGTLNTFTDADGQPAANAEVAVTTSGFIESALSNTIAINEQQQPPATVGNITLRNVEHPDWMTIAVGESFRVEADSAPGQSFECRVEAAGLSGGGGQAPTMASMPMAETPQGSGHYTCQGPVSSRPDVNGAPADFLMAKIYRGGNFADMSDDLLPYRWGINEVHFRNTSRAGAADIAPGERFEITASGEPGKTQLSVMLLDAAVNHSQSQNGPVSLDFSGAVEESPVGSGQYRIEGTFPAAPAGTNFVRAFVVAVDAAQNLTNIAPSTEILGVAAAPPAAPTVITSIDGVAVLDGGATSTSLYPVVAGTAPSNSTVNIYELTPGGSSGNMTPVLGGAAMSAEFAPGVGTYGDNFDDGVWNDKWQANGRWGSWTLTEQNGRLAFNLGSNAQVGLDGIEFRNIKYEDSAVFGIDAALLPSDQNDYSGFIGVSARIGNGQDVQDYNLNLHFVGGTEGRSEVTFRKNDGLCRAPYQALATGTSYRLEMSFSPAGAPHAIVRINGAEVLSCEIASMPSGTVQNAGIEGSGATSPLNIEVDNFETGISVPGGYNISAPSLSYNGADYSFQNMGALLIDPHGGPPTWLPAQEFSGIDGKKDIHAFAVTLHDFRPDPANNPGTYYSEGKITIYSGGAPENPAQDQLDVLTAFMNQLKQMGVMSYYTIDASGVAFAARGAGAPYQPVSPISTQITICREEAGAPGYLNWDAASGKYLASYTPLIYQGAEYKDAVIWGLVQSGGDGPNLVASPNTPIWWATGSEDVSAGVATFVDNGTTVMITGYATAGFFALLPSFGVTIYSQADHVLIAPVAAGQPYTWNQSALDAAGLSTAGQTVCSGYGRRLIASVSAAGAGMFSTQTISFDTYGDKLIQAESVDAVTSAVKSASGIVTYHLNAATVTVDITPPQISGIAVMPHAISPENHDGFMDAASIRTDIYDESGLDWRIYISNPLMNSMFEIVRGSDTVAIATWDGKNESGTEFVPDGIYEVVVSAMDKSPDANFAEATASIVVDNTKPVVADLVQPASGSVATSQVAVTVQVADNAGGVGIGMVQVGIYGQNSQLVDATPLGNGLYEALLDISSYPDGAMNIYIRAVDGVGNYAEKVSLIIKDTMPPVFSLKYPTDNPYYTFVGSGQFVNVVLYDSAGVDKTQFTCSAQGGACQTTWVSSSMAHIAIAGEMGEGTHTVTLHAADLLGHTSDFNVTFVIDKTKPSIANLTPANGQYLTPQALSGASARLSDNLSGIAESSISVLLNGYAIPFTYDSVNGNLAIQFGGLEDGSYSLTAYASDRAGNQQSVLSNFYVDGQPPAGVLAPQAWPDAIGEAGEFDDDNMVYLTWNSIQDNSGGSGVAAYYAGIEDGSPYDNTGLSTQDDDTTFLNGPVQYCVYAVDKAGNSGAKECDAISVSAGGLVVSGVSDGPDPISPAVGDAATNNSAIISANIYGTGLTSWRVNIYPSSTSTTPVATLPSSGQGTGNSVNVEWFGKNNDGVFLPNATYTYRIMPQGGAGAIVIPGEGSITIDNASPTVQLGSLPSKIEQQIYNIQIFASDTHGLEKVQVAIDGAIVATATWASGDLFIYPWNVAQEKAGAHNIVALATDLAKNIARTATASVQTSEQPIPDVLITAPADGAAIRGNRQVSVNYNLKQGNVKTVELYIISGSSAFTQVITNNLSKPYQSSGITQFALSTASYPDGYYYVVARAIKTGSGSLPAQSATKTILIDNTPAAAASFTPVFGSRAQVVSVPTSVIVSAALTDGSGSGIASASLSINGGVPVRMLLSAATATTTARTAYWPLQGLGYGDYSLVMRIYDVAGNETVINGWTFGIKEKPVIKALCPISGPAGSVVTISGEHFSVSQGETLKVGIGYLDNSLRITSAYYGTVISRTDTEIRVQLPLDVPVSQLFLPAERGLARLFVEIGGQLSGQKIFQVTNAPVNYGKLIYIANRNTQSVSVLDQETLETVATIREGFESMLMTDTLAGADGRHVYVLSGGSGLYSDAGRRLAVIDTSCNAVVSSVQGVEGSGLTLSPKGDRLYAWNGYNVYTIDAGKAWSNPGNALLSKSPSGSLLGTEASYSPSGIDLYSMLEISFRIKGELIESDPYNATLNNLTTSYTDGRMENFAVTPDGRFIIASYPSDDLLVLYSSESQKQVAGFNMAGLDKIKVHPSGDYLYALSGNAIKVLDIRKTFAGEPESDQAVVTSLNVSGRPMDIEFSADGAKAYVLLNDTNKAPDPFFGTSRMLDTFLAIDINALLAGNTATSTKDIVVGDFPNSLSIQSAPVPHIESASPTQGFVGDEVAIAGSNFSEKAEFNHVLFNGIEAKVIQASSNSLRVIIPDSGVTGGLVVSINARWSNPIQFTVLDPVITTVTPAIGAFGQGVVIKGAGFSEIPYEDKLVFNNMEAAVNFASRNTITTTVPFMAQTGNVTLRVGGKSSNSLPFTVPGPELSITSPATGTVFNETSDTDGNSRNGVQIEVSVLTSLEDGKKVQLTVNDGTATQTTVASGSAAFNKVTLLPGANTIKAFYEDEELGAYGESKIGVTLIMPTEQAGNKVAFSCTGRCASGQTSATQSIFVKNMDDGLIAQLPGTDDGCTPSWRSDGRKIVYGKTLVTQLSLVSPIGLFVYDVDSKTSRMIVDEQGDVIKGVAPAWSPNGKYISYYDNVVGCGFGSCGNVYIVSVDFEGNRISGPINVANKVAFNNNAPVWTQNGRYLIYDNVPDMEGRNQGLGIAAVSGSTTIIIASGTTGIPGYLLDWVPGSDSIASSVGIGTIFYTSFGSKVPVPVYQSKTAEYIHSVTVSPDGNRFLYKSFVSPLPYRTYLYDLMTANRSEFLPGEINSGQITSLDWLVPLQRVFNAIPPVVSDLQPADLSYSVDSSVVLRAKIIDDQSNYVCGIDSVKLIVNDTDVSENIDFNPLTSVMTYILNNDDNNLGEIVSYKIQAEDCVGNKSEWTKATFRFGFPPKFDDLSPIQDGAVNGADVYVSAKIVALSSYEFSSGYFLIDEKRFEAEYASDTKTLYARLSLGNGRHTAKVVAIDTLGFSSNEEWQFYVDRSAPEISDIYPANGEHFSGAGPVCIAEITDGINGSGINADEGKLFTTLYYTGSAKELPITYVSTDNENNQGRLIFNPNSLPEGKVIAVSHVEDKAGNSVEFSWEFEIDKSGVNLTVLHPLPNSVWNNAVKEISVLADLKSDDIVVFLIDGKTCYYEKPYRNLLSCSVNIPVSSTGDGRHYAYVKVEDSAGNIKEASWSFFIRSQIARGSEIEPEINELSITPKLLNNTSNQSITMSYTLTRASFVTIHVDNVTSEAVGGETVRNILYQEAENPGRHTHTWDGVVQSQSGLTKASPGAYRIYIEARVNDSLCNPNCLTSFVPDLYPSDMPISNYSQHIDISPLTNKRASITYTLTHPSMVKGIIGRLDGPVNKTIIDDRAEFSGAHTAYWDGRVEDGLILEEAKYDFSLIFRPLMMNAVVVETVVPNISGYPENELVFNPDAGLPISIPYTLSNAMTISAIVYNSNNELVRNIILQTPTGSGAHTLLWDGTNDAGVIVDAGVYTVSITDSTDTGSQSAPVYLSVQVVKPTIKVSGGMIYVFGNPGDILSSLREDDVELFSISSEAGSGGLVLRANTSQTTGAHTYKVNIANPGMGIAGYDHVESINLDASP